MTAAVGPVRQTPILREICNESGRIKRKRKKKKEAGRRPAPRRSLEPGRSPGSGGARDFAALKIKKEKKRREKKKEKRRGEAPRQGEVWSPGEARVRAKPETSRHFARRSPDYHDGGLRDIYCLGANPRAHTQLDNDGDACSGRGRLL